MFKIPVVRSPEVFKGTRPKGSPEFFASKVTGSGPMPMEPLPLTHLHCTRILQTLRDALVPLELDPETQNSIIEEVAKAFDNLSPDK